MPNTTVDFRVSAPLEEMMRLAALSTSSIAGCTATPLPPATLIVRQRTMTATVASLACVGIAASVIAMGVFYGRTFRPGAPIDASWLAIEGLLVVLVVLLVLAVALVRYSFSYLIDVVADAEGSVLRGTGSGADWEGHFIRIAYLCVEHIALSQH
jgi:hypothetical protein